MLAFGYTAIVSAVSPVDWLQIPAVASQIKPFTVLPLSAYCDAYPAYKRARRWMEVGGFGYKSIVLLSSDNESMIVHEISRWSDTEDAMIIQRRMFSLTPLEMEKLQNIWSKFPNAKSTSDKFLEGDDFGFFAVEDFSKQEFNLAILTSGKAVNDYRKIAAELLSALRDK